MVRYVLGVGPRQILGAAAAVDADERSLVAALVSFGSSESAKGKQEEETDKPTVLVLFVLRARVCPLSCLLLPPPSSLPAPPPTCPIPSQGCLTLPRAVLSSLS